MPRIIDLVAVFAVAVVLLLPSASIVAQPALVGDPLELDRLSELEDARFRHPDDAGAALELADAFLSFYRSDWAISTLAAFADRPDYRVHMTLATAHAERLEAAEVVREGTLVEQDCELAEAGKAAPKCPSGTLAKIDLIKRSMQVLVEQHIDPAKDPQHARDEVAKVLHSARYRGPMVNLPPKK